MSYFYRPTKMKQKTALNLPLLALNFIGTLILTFGVLEAMHLTHLMPKELQFQHYGWVFIAFGFMLEMPFIVWMIKQKSST